MAVDPWSYAKETEHSHQVALFMWANMAKNFGLIIADDPRSYIVSGFAKSKFEIHNGNGVDVPITQLKWLHAVHNQGHGDAIRGAKAKAEGVKEGVADIFLPVPIIRHDYLRHGLYIELKVGKNTPSPVQADFLSDMREAGYDAVAVNGWLTARKKILDYLGIGC